MADSHKLVALYLSKHKELSDRLGEAEAKAAKSLLQQALLVTDVTVAATFDIGEAIGSVSTKTRQEYERDVAEAADTNANFESSITNVMDAGGEFQDQMAAMLACTAKLRMQSAVDAFGMASLQWELLYGIATMWLGTLGELYGASDRAAFFARAEKIVEFGVSHIPILGDVLDVIKVVAETITLRKQQFKSADEYFKSIESYIDGGNLFIVGVFSFCLQVECLMKNIAPPTDEEIEARIAQHFAIVTSGKHPTCRRSASSA